MKGKSLDKEIVKRLHRLNLIKNMRFTAEEVRKFRDPYRILIGTILSQNTNDENSIRAFSSLDREIGISVENLNQAPEEEIARIIRVSGMYNIKARYIKKVSKVILEKYGGSLDSVLNASNARELLLELPGVGYKTADILLMFTGRPSFPVDTHISRITRRIGLVSSKAGYEEISNVWRTIFDEDEYLWGHLSLIAFGRKICKAINPKCRSCVLSDLCNYYKENFQ